MSYIHVNCVLNFVSLQITITITIIIIIIYKHDTDSPAGSPRGVDVASGGFDVTDDIVVGNGDGLGDLSNENEMVTSMRQLTRLIADMSKYTILVTFAISSTFISVVVVTITSSNIGYEGRDKIYSLEYNGIIYGFDLVVNCICLTLQFKAFKSNYLWLCNFCHGKCQDRYTNQTNKHNSQQLQRLPSGELIFKIDDEIQTAAAGIDSSEMERNESEVIANTQEINLVAQRSVETLGT